MKRFSIVMTMAMLLILSIVPAYAIEIFPITDFKFTGNTTAFRLGDGYLSRGSQTQVGDIIYSVGKVTHTVDPATGDTYGLDPNEEYTYYIGGLQIIVPDTPGSVGYLGVDPDSPVTDPISGDPVAWMVVWKDTIPDFALADGPAANPEWGSPYPSADPTETIINDGTPWITGVLQGLPTWLDPRAVALTHISSFNPINGHTTSFIHLQSLDTPWGPITGSFNSQITSGYYGTSNTGLSLDAQMLNTLQPSLVNGWFNRDNDPVTVAFAEQECTLQVEKKCVVPPEPGESECETKIAAMLLRYTGPDQTVVNVEFKGKSGATATYIGVDLISGVTELSGQNGFTIDAAASGKADLGAKTTIKISGDKEEIHTSCSTPFVAGEPAPLDRPKGDPSPNWFVVSFRDKNGTVVPPPDPVPADLCMISEGGDDVEYTYTITNTGIEDVFDVTVEDDQLVTVPGSPILSLASGAEVTLTATQFVMDDTINVVTVTGKTGAGETCSATDSAEVIVKPLLFECDKPIKELTMIWDGTEAIRVKAWKGKPGSTLLADIDNIKPGDEVAVDGFTGKPNDVIWEIFDAGTENKIGESKFHLSCSDKDMNGPEDCGKPQGDGKKNESKYINDWLLEGMVDKTSSFDCTP